MENITVKLLMLLCVMCLLFGCTNTVSDPDSTAEPEVQDIEVIELPISWEEDISEIEPDIPETEAEIPADTEEDAGEDVKIQGRFSPEQNAAYKLFYGTWEITQVVYQHRNQGDEGYEDILGMQITYLPEMYGFGGMVKVDTPNYIMAIVPLGRSFIEDMTVSPYVKDDWFIYVEIDGPYGVGGMNGREYGFEPYVGSSFFIIDDSTLYLYAYNCYYEMKRVGYMSEYDHLYDRIEGTPKDEDAHFGVQNYHYKLFYGTWNVTDIISEHRRLGGDEGYEDALNMQITYLPEYYECGDDIRIDIPDYLVSILPMSEVYLSSQEQSIKDLLPDNDYVVYIQVTGQMQGMEEQYLGTEFFIKDDNTLYCVANNCIYELTRESYIPDYDPLFDTRWPTYIGGK